VGIGGVGARLGGVRDEEVGYRESSVGCRINVERGSGVMTFKKTGDLGQAFDSAMLAVKSFRSQHPKFLPCFGHRVYKSLVLPRLFLPGAYHDQVHQNRSSADISRLDTCLNANADASGYNMPTNTSGTALYVSS